MIQEFDSQFKNENRINMMYELSDQVTKNLDIDIYW